MSDWRETLRFVDEYEGLIATVQLDFLRRQEPVRVHLNDFSGSAEHSPEASVEAVLQHLPILEKTVADAAFEHYQQVYSLYGKDEELPVVADATALLPFYQLHTIYLPDELEIGRFGLGFECEWEIEHGFGLQFRNWKIVEVGGDAEAFSFYD